MSIIKRYQAALRHRTNPRYMTKDFIVPLYTGTEPEILDDSNTQRESSVYKEFPNDMPIISPKRIQNQPYEQLELADGGRVSFKKGGQVIENDYLFNFMKKNSGTSHLEKAKKLNKLGFTNSRGGKITDSLLEKFITQNQELKGLGAQIGSFTLDEVKKYARPKQLQDFESGLIDEATFRSRVNQYRGDLKRTPEEKILRSRESYARTMADPERRARRNETSTRYNEKRYLEKGMYPPSKNPKDAIWRDLLRAADEEDRVSLIGKRPNKYPRDVFESLKLKDNETGKIITYKNLTTHPEYEKAIKPYEIKFQINKADISPETKRKITFQRGPGGSVSNIVIQHNQGIGKNPFNTSLAIQSENIQEHKIRTRFQKKFENAETLSDKKEAINTFKKDLEQKAPNILSQPGKKAYGVETDAEGLLKTSKVPASERRKIIQTISNFACGAKTQALGLGGRVNFTEGSDCFNKGLKMLEEGKVNAQQLKSIEGAVSKGDNAAEVIKNLYTFGKQGGKLAGKGLVELLSIGTGPIGAVAGAAVETAFAAPYLLEGDYKQALRQSIFGQVPSWLGADVGSRDEDIVKLAKDAGVDQDSVRKYVDLKKNYIENEEYGKKLNMLDTMYKRDPNNFDYAEQIRRIENKIKPSADYLEKNVYAPKDLDKYEKDYLKAANYFVRKNAAQAPFTRSEEQIKSSTRDIAQDSLSAVRQEQDVENILRKENLLPQETQPQEDLPDYYKLSAAEGGRVELGEGSGPKIGRRGFLGLIAGAAAAPDLIKAIKGTSQVGKIASKIKLEPAEGMYPWFPKLVEKIKDMGKPFEEKQLIMEPSYKNDPRPFGSRQPTGEEKLTKHVDGDTTFILREYPDGRLAVDIDSPRNQQSFGQPVSLYYRPKMEFQNYKGEKKIEPPEFKVLEPEPRPFVSGPDDVDITFTEVPKNPKRNTVFGDIEAAERFATGNIKNRKIISVKQSLRNEMEEDPSTFIMRQSGELGSKARPEEIIKLPEEFATGGRVGFGDGSKDPNKLIPIDPLLQDQSPTDPGRRDVLKLGIAGAGVLGLGKLGLLKLGTSVKTSVFAEAAKGTTAPSWMDSLMTKIIKEGTEIKMPKESSIIKKEVQFKNPETGDVQTATLTIDSKEDRMFIEYDSPTNVANQPVVLELSRERKVVPNPGGKSNWFAPDKTKGYNFYATETGPRVVDWDGNIEFDREDTAFKIIDLKSDISGLKSYATEGKGIDKKIAKQKRAATADIEKNPEEYVPDWEPEIYD